MYVFQGGVSRDESIYSGGVEVLGSQDIYTGITTPGGDSFNATIYSGGELRVRLSGVAHNTRVLSGGLLNVIAGGSAVGATIYAGGLEDVEGTATINTGGSEEVVAGTTSNTTIDGGTLELHRGLRRPDQLRSIPAPVAHCEFTARQCRVL
jgi:autotransporter passenger strand-loop-strand repeat protein